MFESISWSLLARAAEAAGTTADAVSPWYLSGWVVFLGLLALLAACWYIGNAFAKSIRHPEYGTRCAVILTSIVVATLVVLTNPLRFGVDLRGGMNLIGSLNTEVLNPEENATWMDNKVTAKDIIPRLLKRVDPAGVNEIMIRPLGESQIEVTIPDVDSEQADQIWNRLVKAGHLEFRIVADDTFTRHKAIMDLAIDQNELGSLARDVYQPGENGQPMTETVTGPDGETREVKKVMARWYSLAREDDETGEVDKNKLRGIKFVPGIGHLLRDASTNQLIDISRFRSTSEERIELQLAQWMKDSGYRTPQILLLEPETETSNVEGSHISQVRTNRDDFGNPGIGFTMTDNGATRMGLLTTRNKPDSQGRKSLLGIVIDQQLHSAPSINSPISKNGEITGRFTDREVDELKINLRSGKLDVALNKNPISKQYIESHLGNELKTKGLTSIGISFLLVLGFMCVYYRFSGFVACAALFLNLLLILALVMAIKQPLTLTGLAGLVLTIGMSVDANVLIFERIREELERGSGLRMAINNGFEKATTTIVDANVTTLITALVLYVIGTEQVKGFSVTLILGILMSMFTAIYCAKTVFLIAERKRWITRLNMMKALTRTKFDFLGKRMITGMASLVLIVCGLAGMWYLGAKILNHDLRGGSTARVVFQDTMEADEVRTRLEAITKIDGLDEELEFTVSPLRDPAYPKRVFKIDSNLPTYDGTDQSPYMDLGQLLADTFDNELTMLNVKVGEMSMVGADGAPIEQTGSDEPVSGDTDNSVGMNWRMPRMLDAVSLIQPMSLVTQESPVTQESAVEAVQESAGEVVQEVVESAGETVESAGEAINQTGEQVLEAAEEMLEPAAETQEPATEPEMEGEAPADENQSDEIAGSGSSDTQTPETVEGEAPGDEGSSVDPLLPGGPDTQAPGSGGAFQVPDAPALAPSKRVKVQLNFEQAITGKALRTILSESASSQSIELAEEQIEVAAADFPEDDDELNPLSFPSKDWSVTLDLSNKSDAQNILGDWAQGYNNTPYFPTVSGVGGQIAQDNWFKAIGAIIASLLGIIAYVWIRFQNVAFGLAAVVALIHDVLIVLGAIALSHFVANYLGFIGIENFKISLPVVAALLTIIGYSLNDTIVVFDRIREVRGKRQEINEEMINTSICQTLSRTILTSLTTFIVVFILFAMGGDAIHGFAFSLVIGVIVGTYSSIFVASPTLLWLMNTVGLNPGTVVATADEK